MPFKKIPQHEARSLKSQVKELTQRLGAVKYRANLAERCSTEISTVNVSNADAWIVVTAKRCKKIVVALPVSGKDQIKLYAVDP